jgi:hypothetical protein
MLQFHWERIGKEDFILKFQRKAPELTKIRFPCQHIASCKTYRKEKAFSLLDQLFVGIQHTSSLLQSKSYDPHKAKLTFVKTTLREYETALVKSVFMRTATRNET